MLAQLTDWGLRLFEERTLSPATIQWIGQVIGQRAGDLPRGGHLRALQNVRLRRLVTFVFHHSPFYRGMFDRLGLHPSDIRTVDHLRYLPFTTPTDLRTWQDFLCLPSEQMAAVFTTSGTTGEPKRVYYTLRDLTVMTNFAAAVLRWSFPKRLVALLALPGGNGLWIGSNSAQRIIERAGGLALPVGSGDPRAVLQWMRRFEPNLVISSPTYLTILTRQAQKEQFKIKVEQLMVGGEPFYPEQRDYISAYWDAPVINSYGATELGGAQTLTFVGDHGLALNEFHLIPEIVDPHTGEPAEEGELAFTTLRREGMPLLRYRIGDRARWVESAAGLPVRSIELLQRTDDFMILADMGLYGQVIANALRDLPGFGGKVAFSLSRRDLTDRLLMRVEGQQVDPEGVRRILFDLYPELPGNLANGSLLMQIETGADLNQQLKALRIIDERQIG